MGVVVGIDADTRRVAYAVWRDGVFSSVYEIERSNAAGAVFGEYDTRLTALVRKCQEWGGVIYLEDTFLAGDEKRNVVALKSLVRVSGEIQFLCRRHTVPVRHVMANEWRSAVLGQTHGRERLKELAGERASALTGRDDLTEHMAEAVLIGEFGVLTEQGIGV